MLGHTVSEGHVIILAPATEGMEKQDGIAVALSDELLAGVLQEEDVSIVEWVSDLEGVDDVGVLLNNFSLDLSRSQSVLVIAVVEDGSGNEAH